MTWYDPSDWGVDDIRVLPGIGNNPFYNGPKVAGAGSFTGGQVLPGRFPQQPSSGAVPIGDWWKPKGPTGPSKRQVDPNPNVRQKDPLEELYEQLAGAMSGGMAYQPSYQSMPLEDMESRAQALVSSQYDPQIDAINRAIGDTQGRAERNKTELGNMYQALSQAYQADVPKVQALYDNAQIEAINRQKALQDSLNQDYAARQATVNAEAAALGQEEAAAHVNQGIGADQAFLTNLANTVSEQNNANLGLLENANVAYTQQGGTLAGLEGNNRQADLMTELEDYIRAQQGDIEGLQNSRQADYVKYLSDMQMQDRESQMQENQFRTQFGAQQAAQQWQQAMDLAGLKMEMSKGATGPTISDQISAARLGMDQSQNEFSMNKTIMEMALQIAEQQKIPFEEAMQFVQTAIVPQMQR